MMKQKPLNIFDFYAPTGSISKIADFGATIKKVATPSTIPSCEIIVSPNIPYGGKKDYTWTYILVGAIVIAGIVIAVKINRDETEEKERKANNKFKSY